MNEDSEHERYKITLVRLKEKTHLFNANQKCFVVFLTGDTRICVRGKHRGKGRYITAWIDKDNIKSSIEIDADEELYKRIFD